MSFTISPVRFASLVLRADENGKARILEYYNNNNPLVYLEQNPRPINMYTRVQWPELLQSAMKTLQRGLKKRPGNVLVVPKGRGLDDLTKVLASPGNTTKSYQPAHADFLTPLLNCLQTVWHPLDLGARLPNNLLRSDPFKILRDDFINLADTGTIRLNPKAKPTDPFLEIRRAD